MSISTTATSVAYSGNNSSSTAYSITYKYLDESHITVYRTTSGGVSTDITGTCTFAGDGSAKTGEFTTATAYDNTNTITAVLDIPLDQPVALVAGQKISVDDLEIQGFDRLNMQIRRVWRWVQNSIRISGAEGGSTGTADTLLGFDGSGDIEYVAKSDFVTSSHTHTSTDISDSTADGRALLTSADANPFTDADEAKLDGIEAGATADQTGAEIKTALFAEADTNNFTDADHSKLDGIEASADVTDATNVASSGAVMADGSGNDITGDIVFTEKADHSSTPGAGKGYLWVKNDTPSSLIFTDDAGNDTELGSGGGASQLSDLSDVTSAGVTDKFVLAANGSAYVGRALVEADISDLGAYITGITGEPLSDLSDVTITSIASGEVLRWNGSAWINQTHAEAGLPTVTTGAGAPGTTPTKEGDIYIDTTNDNAYVAVGTATSGDWNNVSAGGASDHGLLAGLADDDHTQYSLISSQAGAPSSTPSRVGEVNVDTTNDNIYISADTVSSGDWLQVNGSGGNVATDAIFDAAGDLVVGTGADTSARLAIGTSGHVLTSNGTTATWAAPTGGGGATTETSIYIDAGAMWAPSGAADSASTEGTNNGIDVWNINTSEFLYAKVAMPPQWDTSTDLDVDFFWASSAGTATQNVKWGVAAQCAGDDDAWDTAFSTTDKTADDAIINNTDVHVVSVTGVTPSGTPADSDLLFLKIVRETAGATASSDDAQLLGIRVKYQNSLLQNWYVTKLGDESTDATGSTSVAKTTWYAPAAGKIHSVAAGATTATSGGALTADVHKAGTTIFSTKITIDSGETDTSTAATPAALTASPTSFAAGDKIEFFCDSNTAGAAGLHIDLLISWD